MGLISCQDLNEYPTQTPYSVNFKKIIPLKENLLEKAYDNFSIKEHPAYQQFLAETNWLKDYALFRALKKHFPGKAWYQWESLASSRDEKTLGQIEKDFSKYIRYYQFEQFIFHTQWTDLHNYADDQGIEIFGDIPIYVCLDSVDVWANQEIFELDDKTRLPTHVSGVPPDYFSKTGQKWGNPLYRWNCQDKNITNKLNAWWINRFKSVFNLVDMARIDHFRGFESYWSVPDHFETALKGEWQKGPGKSFFETVFKELGPLKIVAEDLGEITKEVITLRDTFKFPGTKVLQFTFDGSPGNSFLPYNYDSPHSIVYTGTHDNDTTVGWFLDNRLDDKFRNKIKAFVNKEPHDNHSIHKDLIYLALSSTAAVSIFPLQDILGFGSDCRMNTPGTAQGNWVWRCAPEFLTDEVANWLREKTIFFGRGRTTYANEKQSSEPFVPE
jgi:4-alpha-glucanotransferase